MAKFIQVIDAQNEKRLINVDSISDIYENFIYLEAVEGDSQIKIRTAHNYETLVLKLQNAGVEVYFE